MTSPIKTKLYTGFGVAAGVLLLSALAALLSINQLRAHTDQVEHSYRVMLQLRDVELRMKDTRTSARSYLLTAEPQVRALYQQSLPQIERSFAALDSLTRDDPTQQQRWDTLETMIGAERRTLAELTRNQAGLTRSAIQTGLDTERQTMRAAERLLSRGESHEQELLVARRAAQSTYQSLTPAVLLLSGVLAVGICLWLFWRASRELGANERLQRELSGTYASIAQRIGIIERLAEQVVRGDYKVKIKDKERDSLGNLANSLNRMTENLDGAFSALEKRNRELDQFAYVASHDLKAPLRGVSTVVRWIEEELGHELSPKMREYFGLMKGRLTRLEDLINGLLSYARVGRTQQKLEEVSVTQLLHEVADLVVPAGFVLHLPEVLPVLVTDRLSLGQVFTNLLSNAVKYHHTGQGQLRIGCRELKRHYEFRVEDDGPGIAPEYHEKIFLMFQTLRDRNTAESTGIGLSIVKKIIDEQGGSIQVESAAGQGAAFVFTWPKSEAEADERRRPEASQP